jgi:hypothetical protein
MPDSEPDPAKLDLGDDVYDGDGNHLGTVRGFDEGGIYVTTREGIEALSVEHERSTADFGEAELVWRCANCGAVGEIESIPDGCPSCGAAREELYYWTED